MSKAAELAALIGSQSSLANRNLLINGDMSVAQRGTSLSIVHDGTSDGYACDRWLLQEGNHDQTEGTLAQVAVTDLAGFNNALKWTTTEPESAIAADETFDICQKIEAQDCQRLGYGLSSAKSATLSFYVKSSVTGTYGINVYKPDTTTRQLTSTYTISSANTWEKKTITIPGDTDSSGTIADDNGAGLRISWHLGTGSDYTSSNTALTWTDYANAGWAYGHAQNGVLTTDNATWFLTGVQFEVGEVATPFEHESYGDNLARCQRYYYQESTDADDVGGKIGIASSASTVVVDHALPVPMRSKPSISLSNANIRIGDMVAAGFSISGGSVSLNSYSGNVSCTYILAGFSGLTSYRAYLTEPRTSDGSIGIPQFAAEL
tara:strand:+ start:506 stop:1636 length:1131 start_codon:yes stop_codon:yes gene_type:complete